MVTGRETRRLSAYLCVIKICGCACVRAEKIVVTFGERKAGEQRRGWGKVNAKNVRKENEGKKERWRGGKGDGEE